MEKNGLGVNNLVIARNGKVFKIFSGACIDNAKLFKPIPLTEDWLIKFGFEKVADCETSYQYSSNFEFGFEIEDNKYYFAIEKYNGQCLDVELKHIHQLQNLYFALTQTELEIK